MELKESLKQKKQREVIDLLKRNGFEREDKLHYIKDNLSVSLTDFEIQIAFSDGYTLPIEKIGYMTMLGILTYLELSYNIEMRMKL